MKTKGPPDLIIARVFLLPFLMHVPFEPTWDVSVPISSGAFSSKEKCPGECQEAHLEHTYPGALIVWAKLSITNNLSPTPAKGYRYLLSAVDSVRLSHFPTPAVLSVRRR